MYKIALIIPYFGELPNYFDVWYQSALANDMVDFLIYTDSNRIKSNRNIHVKLCSLEDMQRKIQVKFEFNITPITKPYKLCDFKPAYGDIFSDDLVGYDFWGHCDIDLIFGDLRKFLTDDVLEMYERFFLLGHLSIYKNNEHMNTLYQLEGKYPEKNYKEVFSSNDSWYFDEYGGMEAKTYRSCIKVFNSAPICNFLPNYSYFEMNGDSVHLEWKDGPPMLG